MLFNSFEFAIFFATFVLVFFSAPACTQPPILLAGSYIFYMAWRPSFAILLALTTVVDYATALLMTRAKTQSGRRAAMLTALTINLGILGTVKYLDFLISNVAHVVGFFGFAVPDHAFRLILPLGISFYTFQSIGYTLDVYHRRIEAERNFLTYAQYVSFFPQLIAGPIERAGHMLPQFRVRHGLEYSNVVSGLWLIGWGLFKKMCIADVVSPVVAKIYENPEGFSGSYVLLGTVFFAIQIYCDFSGYSDIARGSARMIGFDLMINFRQPYFATSLTDFWRRWHISLSTWFRDYLFIPLGGSRGEESRTARNLLIVFIASGIWHGAAWTFVIWGGLHGFCLVLERAFVQIVQPERWMAEASRRFLGWLWVAVVVLLGWVFFRGSSLSNALIALQSLTDIGSLSYGTLKVSGLGSVDILILVVSLSILLIVDGCIAFRPDWLEKGGQFRSLSALAGAGLVYYVVCFGVFGHVEFIYFQF
jgi:D-alanyl-lipoteichoic acid acyltransferase DltB (MBOAT superfamily)